MSTPTSLDTTAVLPSVVSCLMPELTSTSPTRATSPTATTSAAAGKITIPAAAGDNRLAQCRAPRKLTPLDRKERDRLRKKEQAKRRLQQIQERDDAARTLTKAKASSSEWHQKEREEEELVLRRLERDVVDPRKSTPVAAGYTLTQIRDSSACSSPVFRGYSHALCPVAQQSVAKQRSALGGSLLPVSTFRHPACHGYTMASDHDSARISPVFFFSGFAKVPLEKVVLENDDDVGNDDTLSDCELDGDGNNANAKCSGILTLRPHEREKLQALMNERFRSASDGGEVTPCLVCKSASKATMGCPGCFTFSHDRHREVVSSSATQCLKMPKTKRQEQDDRQERYKELRRQLVMPSIYRSTRREEPVPAHGVAAGNAHLQDEYYARVLVDHQAIRKHRAVENNFVTLHIKTLPVGSILSLQVDVRNSVAYIYELYRANTELPNRPIHLLLPTSNGLFYLDERIEDATDVRNGLVNGEFRLEDFNLHASETSDDPLASPSRSKLTNNSAKSVDRTTEFTLFSVAVLNANSTPQLIANYLQQNFHLLSHELPNSDRLPVHYALSALPRAVDQDLCQLKLLPHVRRMQAFGLESRAIALAEQREEREKLLSTAFQEKRRAMIEQRQRQNQVGQQNGRPSAKVRRAVAYFEYICDATSNTKRARVFEERLEKLWQCFQLLEEWKICKAGRLVDAETTDATLALLKAHQEATAIAFDRVLERQGPLMPPILFVESGMNKLVVKLGVRLGASANEDREYGLVLDLEQDFDAATADRRKIQTPKVAKKAPVLLAQEEERRVTDALALCADVEWRKGKKEPAMLLTSADLLRPPFYRVNWLRVAQAYKQVMRVAALQSARLDEYNALARAVQSADAILSRAQVAKWQSDTNKLLASLELPLSSGEQQQEQQEQAPPRASSTAVLAQAARRVLGKKGTALLKKRARQRKQQLRAREEELRRLEQLQAESELPRLSLMQQLKIAFARDKAPGVRAALELTVAEKLQQRAAQLLDKVAASASSAAAAAKKEYTVRAL